MTKKKIEDIIEEIDVTLERDDKEDEVNEFIVLTDKIKELEDRAMRSQSEFQNYKRRTEEERVQYITHANGYLIGQILPVLDDFERAMASVKDEAIKGYLTGFNLIHNNMLNILKTEGLTEIPSLNSKFDPNFHQAVSTDHDEKIDKDIILEVFQKGYTLNGKVLRPAMVKVNE